MTDKDATSAVSTSNSVSTNKNSKISAKNVFKITGAIIGFMIGAGFATGQETLQYYTSEGFWGIGGVIIAYAFVCWLFYCFMSTGARTGIRHSREVFQYYCGKYLGWAYEILAILALFFVTTTMVAGVGSIVAQYFGIPDIAGRAIMAALMMGVVLLGLSKMLDVLGPIGPIIVIGLIIIAAIALFSNIEGLGRVNEYIANADPPMLKASAFWWLSGILYGIMNIYPLASFGTAMGADAGSKKEAVIAGVIGCIALALGAIFVTLAQLANLDIVIGQDIPTLALAVQYAPAIATIFGIILLLGIFSTVTPNAWAFSQSFGDDHSLKFNIAAVVMGVGSFVVSFLPYGELLNLIYPLLGWAAYLMIACMIVKHVWLFIKDHRDNGNSKTDAGKTDGKSPTSATSAEER